MYNYSLVSCTPLDYPDYPCLGWGTPHPMEGLVVYISEIFNGNPVNPLQTYTLTFLGIDACIFTAYVPRLRVTLESLCTPINGSFNYVNCETGVFRKFVFPVSDPVNNVLRIDGDCDCWQFVGEDSTGDEILSSYTEYDDCTQCLSTRAAEICPTGERTLSYAIQVKLPPAPPPDRGFKSCCYTQFALADISDNDPYKNDYYSVYYLRPSTTSSVIFKLVDMATLTEYTLNSSTYGVFQDFGGVNADLSFYKVEWQKVLNVLDEGNYQIKQEVTTVGIGVDYYTNTFTLKAWSIDRADNTARIDCIQDGLLVKEGIDFKDTGFVTSLRVSGFFGNSNPSYEQNNLKTRDYNSEQITMSLQKEYKFQGLNLPECISTELLEFIVLGNELFISDYNKNNHSYKFNVLPVELSNNEGNKYYVYKRGVEVNLLFTDRFKNNRKTNC